MSESGFHSHGCESATDRTPPLATCRPGGVPTIRIARSFGCCADTVAPVPCCRSFEWALRETRDRSIAPIAVRSVRLVKLTRAFVLFAALFITVDAGLCPILCLYMERGEHGSSSLPAQTGGTTACGACTCGLLSVDSGLGSPLAPIARQSVALLTQPPQLALLSDIDHPPRQS